MNTAPILNVSNIVNSPVVAKPSSSDNSSDQSFGQVLSREVNGRGNASGDANSNQSNASTTGSTAPSTPTAPAGSKPVKAKPGDNSSQTTDTTSSVPSNTTAANQNESTQMLALVSSIQQSTPVVPDAAATNNAAAVIGADKLAIGQIVGTGTRVATTPSAILPPGTATSSDDADTTVSALAGTPDDAAEIAAETAIKPTIPNNALTASKLNNTVSETPEAKLSPDNPNALLTPGNSATQTTLDLSTAAEKNIQSGLAALNTNSIKTERDIQTTPVIATTINPTQTLAAGQILASDPNDKLTPQVGSAGWDQAVGQKVVWMVAGGQQNASLTLNPPDLGPMQVVLSVNNSHATVTFTASQPEVRQALESAIPKLREMLGDAGIQLGQASINSGSAQQQQTSSQQHGQNAHSLSTTGDSSDISLTAPRAVAISSGLGLVDTFA